MDPVRLLRSSVAASVFGQPVDFTITVFNQGLVAASEVTITDYLPTSVDSYLSLPESFLEAHVNDDGQTPAEELLEHLELMAKGVEELATAIYSGDAQRLAVQGRFLDTKFSKSDLDLS